MNIQTIKMENPFGEKTECGTITIEENSYILMKVDNFHETYSFSIYAKGEGTLTIEDQSNTVSSMWSRLEFKNISTSEKYIKLWFSAGTYYLYKAQLEIEEIITDWHKSTKDIEDSIIKKIPSKLSELDNDVGYLTQADYNTLVQLIEEKMNNQTS